jgi:hypothetical protein
MAQVIWKYPLNAVKVDADIVESMPAGAEIVRVEFQHGVICCWAVVDPDAVKEDVALRIYATGDPVPDNYYYVGTFMQANNSLVWHLFRAL